MKIMRSMTRTNIMPIAIAGLCAISAPRALAEEAAPEPASALWAQTRGFSLGILLQTNFIGAEDPAPGSSPDGLYFDEVGGGGLLFVGYSFTPAFALRLSAGSARHETTQDGIEAFHSSLVLEAHYRFLPRERARPYVFGGLGGTSIIVDTEDYDVETSGGAAVIGAGFLYNITRHLVVDLAGRLDFINWDEVKVTRELGDGTTIELQDPVDDDGGAAKLLLGLGWEF